jgi:pimeloyl-ACP methyl ester carboxylesterase
MKLVCPTTSRVELPEVTPSFDAKRSRNLIPEIAHVLVETSGAWWILTPIFVRVCKRESRWAGDRLLGLRAAADKQPHWMRKNCAMTASEGVGGPGSVRVASLADAGSARLLFQHDDTFWYEIIRSFGTGEYGVSLFAEVLAIASTIQEGDFESWYGAFNTAADRVAREAATRLQRGHKVSARDGFLRASSYYFSSEFFLHANPRDPRVARAYSRCIECYKAACELFDVPILAVEIPYEGKSLPGYFHRPAGPTGLRPTLIVHTGFDGSAEEMHTIGARAAVERGWNALAFDGPGQYGALHRDGLVFRPDWEKVVSCAVDFALTQPDVDPHKIVLMGVSMGGVLAPRAAAFEPRLAALVANDGIYDFGALVLASFPPEHRQAVEAGVKAAAAPDVDRLLDAFLHSGESSRWVFEHGMWATGSATAREFVGKALDYHLREGVAEQIKCPTLVCEAEGDAATRGQPAALYEHLTCRKTFMQFLNAEGAGMHCQVGAGRLAFARIFDWLSETLAD